MAKVYLSPSDQYGNTYAAGNTNEGVQANRICDHLEKALDRCGIEHRRNENMYKAVEESNAWGADLHLPIHTNAFNGVVSGTRVFYYAMGSKGEKAAQAIYKALYPYTPGTSDAMKPAPDLYELRKTNAPCAYVEVDFHDVAAVAQWIIDNVEGIAEHICMGVCDHFGVPYISPNAAVKPNENGAKYRYRVFMPDFNNLQEANDLRNMLTGAGYAVILEEVRAV